MKKSNENNIGGKLRASRALNAVLSVLLVLSVGAASIAAASNRFDINDDGKVDTKDLIRIMRYISGSIDENGNVVTTGDNRLPEDDQWPDVDDSDDDDDDTSDIPAYNTIFINGVPVYSYDGSIDKQINKLIRDNSNKGKVYRVAISKKLIDNSTDDEEKDLIKLAVFDYNDSYSFYWKDKNQETVGSHNSFLSLHNGIFKYLRDFSVGDIIPVFLTGEIDYSSNTTSMDKYNGTYDEHSGYVYYDAIIEFEIAE